MATEDNTEYNDTSTWYSKRTSPKRQFWCQILPISSSTNSSSLIIIACVSDVKKNKLAMYTANCWIYRVDLDPPVVPTMSGK